MTSSKLFQPIQIGDVQLGHRVVLAPLTRFRAQKNHVHGPTAERHYTQRASVPGSLLITEGVLIHEKAGGYDFVPGLWSDAQISRWREITDGVHSQGSKIFVQLWSLGRVADPRILATKGLTLLGAGSIPVKESPNNIPTPLTVEEIAEHVQYYKVAAANAIKAGFDGVEIHAANGYLVEQFIRSNSNDRTDAYGGSVEKRSRFLLEVLQAVTEATGPGRVGVRLSPWGTWQDMALPDDEVREQFTYIVTQLRDKFGNLAYLHIVEPRVDNNVDRDIIPADQSNDFIRDIWSPRPIISAGGFKRATAIEQADKYENELIAFGRDYISNGRPDLPLRLKEDLELTRSDREMYYLMGDHTGKGYTDWPFTKGSKTANL